ncbi:hypothetical protein ACPOL_6776 (plasmid) [Acidisarcina polymorpha]|uniref:Uncharacterized protein n=1 Tax=Acidisarcina polymorpha TaxID=2211140 RepID=A0A2Z5GBG2_9BACT|nr:hypothetical protein [Acidisarcina polymorpha]AXC15986.1 hypothetical protein ACPOL_6776 [Acidisarcina polymorpha]
MEPIETGAPLDFESRLRRSQGRAGRKHVASAKVTGAEYSQLQVAAQRDGKALSEWAREVLLREARRSPRDPLFTEIVATRMLLNLVLQHIACGELMTAEMFSDMLTKVRTTKHKQALELMEQYATNDPKEI